MANQVQRFTAEQPCPICQGYDDLPRGHGQRCWGFLSADGHYAHCTRDEHAGQLRKTLKSDTYPHRLRGDCPCGVRHDPSPPRDHRRSGRRQVATYDYTDEQGTLLYQVVRYVNPGGSKTFKQRRPDGKGGWIWNLKGVQRVPYRLPELLAAVRAGQTILVPEGEKDVDRLIRLGHAATCNPMGAKKWPRDFARYFQGAVAAIVLADNDQDGRDHAVQVCAILLPVVLTIKRHDFTNLPKGGDVSDWLDTGHTAEDLAVLLAQASVVTAEDLSATEAAAPETSSPSALAPDPSQAERFQKGRSPRALLSFTTLPPSDQYNAEALVYLHGDKLRYCHPWKRWLLWDKARWKVDDTAAVMRLAKSIAKQMAAGVEFLEDDGDIKAWLRHITSSLSAKRLQAMVELAASEPDIPVLPENLDRDPWLLNVQNGVIDLWTGDLRPHRRKDFITKLAPVIYDQDATCPRWEQFLQEIFKGNEELITFIRRAVGYSLTGDTRERALFICYGVGRNGKSTFLETIAELLGEDYAFRTPTRTLMAKRDDSIPNDVAQLKGKRFVHASESGEGKRLDEEFIKDATGRDTLAARFMRAEWFNFKPEFKLWLRTNHKPIIRGTDPAIWDRPRLIPFTERFEGREDKDLPAKIRAELSGILTWAVQGCLSWQINGLGMPNAVKEATEAYRQEMDVLADWLAECCYISPQVMARSSDLYASYQRWCDQNTEPWLTRKPFAAQLQERGFTPDKGTGGTRLWRGLALLTPPRSDNEKERG